MFIDVLKGRLRVCDCRVVGRVNGLADTRIDTVLQCGLDARVIERREIPGRNKQFADRVGHRLETGNAVEDVVSHLVLSLAFDRRDVDLVCLEYSQEVIVKFDEHLIALHIIGDVLVVGDVVDRLAATGGVANHRRGVVGHEAVREVGVVLGDTDVLRVGCLLGHRRDGRGVHCG